MTHAELVHRACRWLQNSAKCPVVLYEVGAGYEIPDAMGWKNGGRDSILIECKTSRSDFLRDQEKPFRRTGFGVGRYHYYFTPPALITISELPEKWGLLECRGTKVRCIVKAEGCNRDLHILYKEMSMLFKALHRQGDNVKKINEFLSNVWPLRGYVNAAMPFSEDVEQCEYSI
jgi:hypothetical protein